MDVEGSDRPLPRSSPRLHHLPVDIIPEALAGILGLLDDVVLALLVFVYLTILYRRTLANNEG